MRPISIVTCCSAGAAAGRARPGVRAGGGGAITGPGPGVGAEGWASALRAEGSCCSKITWFLSREKRPGTRRVPDLIRVRFRSTPSPTVSDFGQDQGQFPFWNFLFFPLALQAYFSRRPREQSPRKRRVLCEGPIRAYCSSLFGALPVKSLNAGFPVFRVQLEAAAPGPGPAAGLGLGESLRRARILSD